MDVADLADRIRAGERAALARGITVVESSRAQDRTIAAKLLESLAHGPSAHRIGITGSPGAGKSTLIDALGTHLTSAGHKVAVLAIDPSSTVTGGSILGDKSRMHRLARDPNAFVRPSPSRGDLGGVARRTRETVRLCEAAGYNIVLIETVGVGQSETLVSSLVDTVLLLVIPGAGDELQGIKRGIVELADVVAVNKADGDRIAMANAAIRDYRSGLQLFARGNGWSVPVMAVSAQAETGISALWESIADHLNHAKTADQLESRRSEQRVLGLWSDIRAELEALFRNSPAVKHHIGDLESAVRRGEVTPSTAARKLLDAFMQKK